MTEELKGIFPLDVTKCPNCGSERTLAKEVLKEEKAKKKVNPASNAFLFQHSSLITDNTKPVLSVPIILSFFDVCAEKECGTVYCVHAELKMAVPGLGQKQPPPQFDPARKN